MKEDKDVNYVKEKVEAEKNYKSEEKAIINEINQIAIAYVNAKRRILESENGFYRFPGYVINDSQKIVYHIDAVIDSMDVNSRLILENEIKHKRQGEWYQCYCSSTTYYRTRIQIYIDFITQLEK